MTSTGSGTEIQPAMQDIMSKALERATFTFRGTSIEVDMPPWFAWPAAGTYNLETLNPHYWEGHYIRVKAWGVIKMAQQGSLLDELFRFPRQGQHFALIPKPRSNIPLQWAHFGPGAISDTLADVPCSTLHAATLLSTLNDVLGTEHGIDAPGMQDFMGYLLETCQDFGEAYGFSRSYLTTLKQDFTSVVPDLKQKRVAHEKLRRGAVRDGYISQAQMYARRVWDLRSNRVLPSFTASVIWPVSHSWVDEDARADVWTTINGRAWPVPLPRATTLAHVRVELLNLGAEHAWLDVLCLRQRSPGADDEIIRRAEWQIDVPTIGFTYANIENPCVTYFNGLGVPFDSDPSIRAGKRHWNNRVWTMQEATDSWLPGGATGTTDTEAGAREFFAKEFWRPDVSLKMNRLRYMAVSLVEMRRRYSTTPIDVIASLAYVSGCSTLPVYYEDITAEHAWTALLKHFNPWMRGNIFIRHARLRPDDTMLFPTWAQFFGENDGGRGKDIVDDATLQLVNENDRSTLEPGLYFQQEVDSFGTLLVTKRGEKDAEQCETLELKFDGSTDEDAEATFAIYARVGGLVEEGKTYTFLSIMRNAKTTWLVGEVVGTREVQEWVGRDQPRRPAVAVEVRKCGVILAQDESQTLPPSEKISVVYLLP